MSACVEPHNGFPTLPHPSENGFHRSGVRVPSRGRADVGCGASWEAERVSAVLGVNAAFHAVLLELRQVRDAYGSVWDGSKVGACGS